MCRFEVAPLAVNLEIHTQECPTSKPTILLNSLKPSEPQYIYIILMFVFLQGVNGTDGIDGVDGTPGTNGTRGARGEKVCRA